ncbi:NAD(P)H-binding protein [Streptomyces sp. CoH27]|uniref:NAD(P)H-binding protein n=1 Tax=Streptomyces sp. CoH27 TaxID=2875763 RepID=UPI001CD1BBAF|nr:NAD(P)H-binding protein [Streptomyces sp. CoH27]
MTATTSTSRHIVLTGATGKVAPLVARHLAAAGHRLTLTGRSVPQQRPQSGLQPAVRHVVCDYDRPASLSEAFRGADAVFVVTNDPTRPEHDRNILRAAADTSVGHIVKLSAAAVHDPAARDLVTTWQRENEDRIRNSGIPWTMLQPRSFMTHALAWAPGIRADSATRALHPHSRNACIAPEDIAEVAAQVLGDDTHHGRSYQLTGPQALSAEDQTRILAGLLGRPLACRALSRSEAHDAYLRRYPPAMADALLASADRQAAGAKSATTRTVERLTGRAPTTFTQWATAHLRHFTSEESHD